MYLYKIEVELRDRNIHLVLLADQDKEAFDQIEGLLARYYVKMPEVLEAAIVEKKRVSKGAGYVLDVHG